MPVNVGGHIINSGSLGTDGTVAKNIVSNGLICHLDAADINSYPSSGGTWYDLSGTGNHVSIYNNPAWTLVGGRQAFNFTIDGHYMQNAGFIGFPTTQLTMEAWIYPAASEVTSGDRGCIMLISGGNAAYMSWNKSSQYISNYWYGHAPEGYHETVGPSARGAWHHWVSVWDNSACYQYVDGFYGRVTGVSGTSTANTNLQIGRENSARQFGGGIAVIKIYNRALSPAEVYQNYAALKGRFGI